MELFSIRIQRTFQLVSTLHMFVDTLALFKKREAKKGCLFSFLSVYCYKCLVSTKG